MSDYDFEDDNRSFWDKNLASIIAFCVIIPIFFLMVVPVILPSQQKIADDKAFEQKWNQIQVEITKMNCQQLQQLRLDHIAGKDVTPYISHWDSVRDSYNALSCGTHWGFWEN